MPPEEPENGIDRWLRLKAEREEPPPREREPDIAPPTLADIDQRIEERIAAEREMMIEILGDVLAEFKHDAEMRGPPGPAGPPGEQGPPGKLPLVKLWKPEMVFYEGDVVAHDGGTFQAKHDTGQPPVRVRLLLQPEHASQAAAHFAAARTALTYFPLKMSGVGEVTGGDPPFLPPELG